MYGNAQSVRRIQQLFLKIESRSDNYEYLHCKILNSATHFTTPYGYYKEIDFIRG